MTKEMLICMGLFVFMIGGYVFAKKLKTTTGIVALCAIVLTGFTGLVPAKDILSNFSNSNALLISGMFIVSAGFNRTQAVNKLSNLVHKISSGNFTVMLAGYCLMTFVITNLVPSPVTVFTIIAPVLIASCNAMGVSPSKAVFSMCLVSVATCGVLPVGNGAVTYATQNGYFESYGYTAYQMQMFDPFKGRILAAIFVLVYAIFIAPKFCPDQPTVPIAESFAQDKRKGKDLPPLDPVREFLGYAIFVATTLGLVFCDKLGMATWQVALTGAAVVVVTGVLTPKEATQALPIRIVLMLVAALTVGGAMVACGLGDLIGEKLASVLGGTTNGYVIGAAFFIVPFLMTQFMQNQSVIHIFRPIVILTCQALACNPIGPNILMNAACLSAFLTPSATASVPLMMAAGGYDQKDLLKMGWLPAILICVISVGVMMTIFPAY